LATHRRGFRRGRIDEPNADEPVKIEIDVRCRTR
jgi:hypothetical protein